MVRDNTVEDSTFSTGAYVEKLTAGGAAEQAGIRPGDVVVKFAGQAVTSASDLTAMVRAEPAGGQVEVEVLRDGQRKTFQVTLGDASDLR
jgi:putative serine protease PepD